MSNLKVAAIQCGPSTDNVQVNLDAVHSLAEQALAQGAQIVLLSELATAPYFCPVSDPRYFDLALPIPGAWSERFRALAARYDGHIILPMFEHSVATGAYFNSACVIGPEGIVEGLLPDGGTVPAYRKCHLPISYDLELRRLRSNEKFYFSPGTGFCTFQVNDIRIGILICWDKRFTEAWRILGLQGCAVVFNPIATWGPWRVETFAAELRIMAMCNQYFVVGTAKAGAETIEVTREYGGGAHVFDPTGNQLASAPTTVNGILYTELDLSRLDHARRNTPIYRDRRPDLYGPLSEPFC